ncbi:hypothetical protein FPANT_13700 [Fusarium pseudoanthophilum]|uniref:C2H2-type domain-containing protein n=1 Tax=Fusarium pseudoanthophilum TaxID=48495 RepID=A0A8H5KF02_9HYPO|nr:hypothetical protein FPANT_13700 [Fusarium pseudoanthophilum]
MEHRHHSPAIDSFLHEIDLNWYYRAVIAKELDQLDREKFYVDSHKAQLRDARHNVSRREPSEANQYPFLCAFHFTGCDQEFANKRDWKNHVVSQHLRLDRVFWECTEGDCARPKHLLDQWEFPRVNYPSDKNRFQLSLNGAAGGDVGRFANKHDFRIHLLVHHQSTQSYKNESDIISLPNTDVQWLVDRSDSSMRMVCGLPQDLGCPMPQCASVRFTGPAAWDQRLNHAAEHFLANPQCLDVFGGENDAELVQWASSDRVGIYQKTPNACLQKHDCNKSVADSGYSSMPGMHQHQNMSKYGDASSVVPRKIPEWTNDAIARYQPLEEDMYSSATTRGIGDWVQDHQYLTPLMDEETISSVYQSFKEIFSQDESTGNHHTLDASQDLDSGDESDGTPDGGSESAAVEQWFHGWLRRWLAPLTQERPNGIGGRQSTTSQSQNSSSSSSTQRKKGASQPRRLPKRKRANNDDDEGNEERPKSQRTDGGPEVRMLACPYFKRNPRKYGQPKWKSCAYPGYDSMHRLK